MGSSMSTLPPQSLDPMSHVALCQRGMAKMPVKLFEKKLECPLHSKFPVPYSCSRAICMSGKEYKRAIDKDMHNALIECKAR